MFSVFRCRCRCGFSNFLLRTILVCVIFCSSSLYASVFVDEINFDVSESAYLELNKKNELKDVEKLNKLYFLTKLERWRLAKEYLLKINIDNDNEMIDVINALKLEIYTHSPTNDDDEKKALSSVMACIDVHCNDEIVTGLSLIAYSYHCYKTGDFDCALKYALLGEEMTKLIPSLHHESLNNLALIYYTLGIYDESIQIYKDLINSNANKYNKSLFEYNIANAYQKKGEYESAYFHMKNARKLSYSLDDYAGISYADFLAAIILYKKHDYSNALAKYNHARTYFCINEDYHRCFLSLVGIVKSKDKLNLNFKVEIDQIFELNNTKRLNKYDIEKYFQLAINFGDNTLEQKVDLHESQAKILHEIKDIEKRSHESFYNHRKDYHADTIRLLQGTIERNVATEVLLQSALLFFAALLLISFLYVRKLWVISNFDALTALGNRHKLSRDIKKGTPTQIFICDLDFFKKINDTYGHDVGDDILVEFSRVLNEYCKNDDLKCRAYRLGGEEFLILFKDSSVSPNEVFAEIRTQMMSNRKLFSLGVTFSCGSNKFRDGFSSSLKAADIKLYEAKKNGRDQCVF